MSTHILWVDDEIEQLRAQILFLEGRGFQLTPLTNGQDALDRIREGGIDLVFLDEQMPGMDGLQTLEGLKRIAPTVPVVMITKSEEESIMEDAIGRHIADYLIKPVNPNQILLTIKRILDRERIQSEQASREYLQKVNSMTLRLEEAANWLEWSEIYRQLVRWEMNLTTGDETLQQILSDQILQANAAFGRFVAGHYTDWIRQSLARQERAMRGAVGISTQSRTHADGRGSMGKEEPAEETPMLSPDIFRSTVIPLLKKGERVAFILVDCMRYDQWLVFSRELAPLFKIEESLYSSILPTATPFSRNAIFAGLHPAQIARQHPTLWDMGGEESSLNRHEEELLRAQLERAGVEPSFRYEKILRADDGKRVLSRLNNYLQVPLSAFVFNFVDTLVHSRSDSDVIKELSPDARAFRSLAEAWFQHSTLFQMLQQLSREDVTVVITTDHGSIRAMRDTKVFGDRNTATSLRYKYGRSLKAEDDTTFLISRPQDYQLPETPTVNSYLLAREDTYFVYPTNYHKYQNKYRDTFQHGGISMEEMILPVAVLTPKGR